jgi:PEP-CTERM motif
MNSLLCRRLALAATGAAFLACAHAGPVSSAGGLVDLGWFAAGNYTLTGSGTIDICGGGTATMRPDGLPDTMVTCAPLVSDFNPDGSYTADGQFGRSGSNAKIGALIGTFNASAYTGTNPTAVQADEWFLIGDFLTLTLATAGHIYASVNDTFYGDNSGAFDVRVEALSHVPEPASFALVAVALGGLGAAGRRRTSALQPAACLSVNG